MTFALCASSSATESLSIRPTATISAAVVTTVLPTDTNAVAGIDASAMPGALPAAAFEMYDPDRRGASDDFVLRITE